MRNPTWSRDELILALHFYFEYAPSIPRKGSKEIAELSELLNRLREQFKLERPEKFRNENGVYMKLMNILRFDPDYEGKGLQRGSKKEGEVWIRYSSKRDELKRVANSIRSFVLADDPIPFADVGPTYEEEGEEGQILTRVHRFRERDSRLVRRKKQTVLMEHGTLSCEVCSFDFEETYGERGHGFIECHHTRPLSELSPQGKGRNCRIFPYFAPTAIE